MTVGERTLGLAGDLVERQLAEEAQGDDLAVRLGEGRDGGAHVRRTLGADGEHRRVRARARRDRLRVAGGRTPDRGSVAAAAGRVEPADRAPLPDLAQRDADRDPRQPRPERAVAAPAGERAIGGHEGLLGGILGLVQVAEDPMAGPDDGCRFALDEVAVGVAVAGEDGVDDRAITALIIGTGRWSARV